MHARHLAQGLMLLIASGLASAQAPEAAPGATQRAEPRAAAIVARLHAADPVVQSFARLFAHEPNAARPPVPAGGGADPLNAALVEPLREPSRQLGSSTYVRR